MRSPFVISGFCCFCIFPFIVSAQISTPETVIDSILLDAASYIIGQGDENAKVLGLENTFRCGPMSVDEIMLPSNIAYNINVCIAMDKLKVQVAYGFLSPKLSVGHLKLVVNVTVETGLYPQAIGTAEISDWIEPKLDILHGFPIGLFKGVVENELTKTLTNYLQMFIQSIANINHNAN